MPLGRASGWSVTFRTGCRVKVAIAGERSLAAAIREHYYGDQVAEGQPNTAGSEMKLVNALGDTMVRRVEDVKAQAQAQAQAQARSPAAKAGTPPTTIDDRLKRLESLQQKEVRILKTLVELLIEKGFMTRDEYRQGVDQ